ncbi:MAG: hypothetical protein L0I76_29495 [Pseudonocardia sp.]|nr:hypothetical protein [Pseudonocardia sp.]
MMLNVTAVARAATAFGLPVVLSTPGTRWWWPRAGDAPRPGIPAGVDPLTPM